MLVRKQQLFVVLVTFFYYHGRPRGRTSHARAAVPLPYYALLLVLLLLVSAYYFYYCNINTVAGKKYSKPVSKSSIQRAGVTAIVIVLQ